MVRRKRVAGWPLLHHLLDDFTEPWCENPAEVALLHPGLGGNSRLFQSWVPALADHYRVLRLDARGQGASPRPEGYVFTIGSWLDDVLDVLDRHNISRVHWVGTSGGGIIGQYAAIHVPDRIKSLTLIATTAHFRGPVGRYEDWLAPLDRGDVATFLRLDVERRFGTGHPRRTSWIIDELCRTPAETAAELHRWVRAIDLRDELDRIQCPTLVITGELDTLTSLDDARLLTQSIPGARQEILEGYPHNVAYTHPRLVAGIVRRFIDEQQE